MEKLIVESLTSNEFISENIGVTPVEWQSIDSPFCVTEVVDVNSQGWMDNETQLDSRTSHHTYKTVEGQVIHWKTADGFYEPLYEGVAYELGICASLSLPFTAPAYLTNPDGSVTFGTVSFVLFSTTLSTIFSNLSDDFKVVFFSKVNKTLFIGESVLAVWLRNYDWSNKFDSVAIGCINGDTSKLYYYTFDHSHIYKGPSGTDRDLVALNDYNIFQNYWQKKYLNFSFADCMPFIEKIESIADEKIREVCSKWATKIGSVDIANNKKYVEMASEFAEFLTQSKKGLRRELGLFFQGVSYAL